MLKNLSIEGYKPFRDKQEFRLAPLTLIYGPNSAGKSSLLDAIRLLLEGPRNEELKANLHHYSLFSSSGTSPHLEIMGDFIGRHCGKAFIHNMGGVEGQEFPFNVLRLVTTYDRLDMGGEIQNSIDRPFYLNGPENSDRRKLLRKIDELEDLARGKARFSFRDPEDGQKLEDAPRNFREEIKNATERMEYHDLKILYGICDDHHYLDKLTNAFFEWDNPYTSPDIGGYVKPIERIQLNPLWIESDYWSNVTKHKCFELDSNQFLPLFIESLVYKEAILRKNWSKEFFNSIFDLGSIYYDVDHNKYVLPQKNKSGDLISDKAALVWDLILQILRFKGSPEDFKWDYQCPIKKLHGFNVKFKAPAPDELPNFILFEHFQLSTTMAVNENYVSRMPDESDFEIAIQLALRFPLAAAFTRSRLHKKGSSSKSLRKIYELSKKADTFLPRYKFKHEYLGNDKGTAKIEFGITRVNPVRPNPQPIYEIQEFERDFWYLQDIKNINEGGFLTYLSRFSEYLQSLNLNYSCRIGSLDIPYYGTHKTFELCEKGLEEQEESWVTLDNVGTGIAQIFPILHEFERRIYPGLSMIQQPELHLHPQQQADLGEMIATAMADGVRQYVCETHSELIIRRIQRLIRRGDLKKEDVCVLYVNPLDGHSTVEELRLDDQGEFIDIWPNGFFEESLGEMFADDSDSEEEKADSSDEE